MVRYLSPWLIVILSFSLMVLSGCADPKPPENDPSVVSDGSTVYGDGRSNGDSNGEEIVREDPTIYSESGPIEGQRMELHEEGPAGNWQWEPIFFDFDRAELTSPAKKQLEQYAAQLTRNRGVDVLLEGHCDERGTETYNLALGERRAQTVKRYLLLLGVPGSQLKTISYGELRPLARSSDERAWARNRRVHFTFKKTPRL